MPIRKIEAGRVTTVQSANWIGPNGTVWYDEVLGDLRIGDGVTPGGRLLNFGSGNGDTGSQGMPGTLVGNLDGGSPTTNFGGIAGIDAGGIF